MDFSRKTFVALLLVCFACGAHAQTYPDRPVRVLVGFAAGSGPDVLARTIAAQLGTELGQQVVIENRPGANGTLALRSLVQAAADGYTLLYSSSSITPIPYIYKNLPFDILRDLAPIATAGILDGYLMLVNPALLVRTVPEFIAYAKKNRVLYGSPGIGNSLHLAAETFNVKAGLKMEHVPFKGSSEVQTNLIAGHIHVMFVSPPGAMPLVREGQLRAIGYAGSKPFPELPDLPLISATIPGFPVLGSWGMFYAPAKTPTAIVDKLNSSIRKALEVKRIADVVQKAGYQPDGRTAKQTAEFFRTEVLETEESVKAAGIKPQ